MAVRIPSIPLNNGHQMPIFGFGTYNVLGDKIQAAIRDAIDAGYRHFDLAMFYQNEADIGQALNQKIQQGAVDRKDLFIASKLWPTFMSPEKVEPTLRKSLSDLQLDYLDLYLIHWPMSFEENGDLTPLDSEGRLRCGSVDFVDTWKALEKCVDKGLVRSIGISNFNGQQVERLMKHCTIKPANHQIELHIYLQQEELINLCQKYDITITSYRSLGRPGLIRPNNPVMLDDPHIQSVARKYGRSPAQIALRFLTMKNIAVIPKSSTKERIIENLASLDFDISAEDMKLLGGLNRHFRFNPMAFAVNHPEFPFH